MFYMSSFDDVSEYLHHWEHLLEVHGKEVLDVDVWKIAREADAPPHFGNIYQREVLTRIKAIIEPKFEVEIDFYINAKDTHLFVNGERITSVDDFYLAVCLNQ